MNFCPISNNICTRAACVFWDDNSMADNQCRLVQLCIKIVNE